MAYNYTIGKSALSDKDKERLVCLYLNRRADNTIDWDKATAEFECASVASMKVMTNAALKKIENAGGKGGDTPSKTSGKKRKAAAADGGDDEDEAEEATPAKKKGRGRPKKNSKDTVKDEPASEDEGGAAAGAASTGAT